MSPPTFREALRFWLKLGFISFGGPTGQIAIMHTELVDRKKWIDEDRFLHALNFCMLLPGPEATQLATYCGWRLHGWRGGLAAGILFVLPSAVLLWALSWIYVAHGNVPWIAAIFQGLKPAVTAIVAAAVIKIGQRALKAPALWAIAGVAFVAIYFLQVSFPQIVASAALVGFFLFGSAPAAPASAAVSREGERETGEISLGEPSRTSSGWRHAAKTLGISLVLWWTPVLAAGLVFGREHVLVREGVFFGQAAMVTFGGAYAVLPYVSQAAVERYHWLGPAQMLDGLGLAETTPGPLIMVVQFVGFLGGWNHHAPLSPLAMATLGAAITTWTTFVPCFLWVFLGAPHIERLRGNRRLSGALTAVTAAVVGVVLNLAVWFGWQVFAPKGGAVDWIAVAVGVVAFVAMQRFKVGVVSVVLAAGALGFLRGLVL